MNDTRFILCDECGDEAVEYWAGSMAEDLECKVCNCESCGVRGKVVTHETDDWRVRLAFRALTEMEESEEAA